MSPMRKISAIVPDAIAREEVLRAGRAKRVLRQWPEIVGPLLAQKSSPDKYDHGTVWVAVSGSAWAQELRMIKGQILSKLAKAGGEPGLFTDVRFGVRPLTNFEPDDEIQEDPAISYKDHLRELTIDQIAERRLKNWPAS